MHVGLLFKVAALLLELTAWIALGGRGRRAAPRGAGGGLPAIRAAGALLLGPQTPALAEHFQLGYMTGSQRRPGDLEYERPGKMISGAISLAVSEVNAILLEPQGHQITFKIAETYGDEEASIRQVAALWASNVSGYIGPQETCVHEGKMASAFNLPMISYYCTDHETSDKRRFPTFIRTRPPETQISKSVAAVLVHFNWTHIAFFYLDSPAEEFTKVASTILSTVKAAGIYVRFVRCWYEPYHHGYSENPFVALLKETYKDTRIYVILGHYYDHIGLMLAMDDMKLLDEGEYFVVGIDVEQYEVDAADKYLRGPLRDEADPKAARAFRSYIAVAASPTKGYANFTSLVNHHMERPPFNYPNPLTTIGGTKMIRPEAAYLYDAVWLYARALLSTLRAKENPRDGARLTARIRSTHYHSAMGYMVYMDENGDAEGNYTVLGLSTDEGELPGLRPIGVLIRPQKNTTDELPELFLSKDIKWLGDSAPVAEPPCGFHGEKCISRWGPVGMGAAGGAILALLLAAAALYRGWRYEKALDSLLWKLDYRDIKMALPDSKSNESGGTLMNFGSAQTKMTRAMHPLVRTSQVSLSSNPDADFRYSSIFTEIGIYRGRVVAIKRVRKKSIDITRDMKKELKTMRDLRHDNLNGFVGACTDAPNICIVTEYCNRGSLKDILENDDVKLDNMFIASLVGDIIRGMVYLHESPLKFHGSLRPSNCLVDSRWVVKLADFGLNNFRKGEEPPLEPTLIQAKMEALIYRAPELLRGSMDLPLIIDGGHSPAISKQQKADVYAFSMILYEMHARKKPFSCVDKSSDGIKLTIIEIVSKVAAVPAPDSETYRPSLEPLESSFDFVRECLLECWAENPEERPDFKCVRGKLRPLRKGMKPNIFDNMMAMMEKYANNLEALVDERTDQLQEEKKKTEALLLEMLPRPVAEQLKRGNKVHPESFDCVTIYFSDIVGFTAMSAESTPLEVVDFLNDLYTCFDSILENFDVYKVETIGDAYMVVSGLPIKNGDQHAAEIASMALYLLRAVRSFRVRHRSSHRLLLRVGLHSGPVCAGVVGLKMPRYCLFGDTVNTASRMESTGAPLKIHCSAACKRLLDKLGGYKCTERGLVAMKGKHDQLTYWLIGEDDTRVKRRSAISISKDDKESKYALDSTIPATFSQGPRSSLKNKHLSKGPLHRCSSLESPKKLRFASGNLLEFYNYSNNHHSHSDDYLLEVTSDKLPPKTIGSRGLLAPPPPTLQCMSCRACSSCPCIEVTQQPQAPSLFPERHMLMPTSDTSFHSVPSLHQNANCTDSTCEHKSAPTTPCDRKVECRMQSEPPSYKYKDTNGSENQGKIFDTIKIEVFDSSDSEGIALHGANISNGDCVGPETPLLAPS